MNFVDAVDDVIVIDALYRGVLNFYNLYLSCKSVNVYQIYIRILVSIVHHSYSFNM